MGNLKDVIAVKCDECNGAGFLFYGNDNDFDVMQCDCIPADEDFLEMIWGA
jgi:hypothetical protein